MSTVTPGVLRLPVADAGPVNPLPMLAPYVAPDAAEPEYGALSSVYPYCLQDGYTRHRRLRDVQSIVLENERLRAEFLPHYGGRLFSLIDKCDDRELLHRNAILQPANLALRDAWFAGGVEWNIGATGHTPLTCDRVFAARIFDEELGEGVRIYAWERIREVVYSVDFWLPGEAAALVVHVAISNPHDHDVPMYWWSNIAVRQTDDLRVITPASRAFRYGYQRGLGAVDVPIIDGRDVSRPANATHSVDYFFDLEGQSRPWIAAVDSDGSGLLQSSTSRLFGRKLFCWGNGPGGRRWQEFLSGQGHEYCEIQAGLARTQLERTRMPARARWEWTETYSSIRCDPDRSHGADWDAAIAEVASNLEGSIPGQQLKIWDERCQYAADRPVTEVLVYGDGWAALEQRLRRATGQDQLQDAATPFPDASLTPDQTPWTELLDHGRLPAYPVISYVAGAHWRKLLERSAESAASLVQRGILLWQEREYAAARALWKQVGNDPIALRCLAQTSNDIGERADLLLKATELAPDTMPLALEAMRALIDAGRPNEALGLSRTVSDATGRAWLLALEAAVAAGELVAAGDMLAAPPEIAGLREGELSLEQLWFRYHEAQQEALLGRPLTEHECQLVQQQHPIPAALDFRMAH